MTRCSCARVLLLYMLCAAGSLIGVGATVKLVNNGYEGVVVVIKDKVAEKATLLDRIQEAFTNASKLLFTATKNRAYFRNITIVVPKKWKKLQDYNQIPSVNVFAEHIRIDKTNKANGGAPYVRGNMECGKPGWFMHLTPGFLKLEGETPYGPHANAIVHEWGHLRWGLFDEYPSIANPNATNPSKKINFYTEGGSWKPVTCSKAITGNAYRGNCNPNKTCNLKSAQLSKNCKFCPDRNQTGVKASLMAVQWLQTMDSFCEEDADSTDPSVRHNSKAQNLQNKICNGQSAWEVMSLHEDFINGNNSATYNTTDTTPSFQIVQETGRIRMFVFDVSGSMGGDKITKQKQAAWLAIDNLVETGSWLGIVSFSGGATLLADLTEIRNKSSRNQLKDEVPTTAGGSTNIFSGLKLAVETIEDKFMTTGTEIILLSDGISNPYLHIIEELQTKGITVHTIAITNAADQGMADLAQATSGSSFTYLETETVSFADVLSQAITNGNTASDSVEKIFSESYKISSDSHARGTFIIDEGLGNNTLLTILLSVSNNVAVSVISPNNVTYSVDKTTDMLTLEIPDKAEVGYYLFNITTASTSTISSTVSVTSQPVSQDVDILRVTSRMSKATLDFKSSEQMKVYTTVEKGGSPVLNGNVTAILAADSGYIPTQITMRDSGTGADGIPNDGVYSAYLLKTYFKSSSRRYNIKIRIVGDGHAFTYTTDVDIGGRSTSIPGEVDEIEFEELQLDEFQRQSIPGEITVVNYIANPSDTTPPAKITDLHVDNIKINGDDPVNNSITYTLSWTAVGDDMDIGRAANYDLRIDKDNRILRNNFTNSRPVQFPSMDSPKQSGEQEQVYITFTTDECNGTCFLALRARDNSGLESEISNLINIDVDFSYEPEEVYTTTTTEKSTSTVVTSISSNTTPTETKPLENNTTTTIKTEASTSTVATTISSNTTPTETKTFGNFTTTTITTEESTSTVATTISSNTTPTEAEPLEEKWVFMITGGVGGLLIAIAVSAVVITCIVNRRSKSKRERRSSFNAREKHVDSFGENGLRQTYESEVPSRYSHGNDNRDMPVRGHVPRAKLKHTHNMYPIYPR